MKDLTAHIRGCMNESLFDAEDEEKWLAEQEVIIEYKRGLSSSTPKKSDPDTWVAYWCALRDALFEIASEFKRGQIERNLKLFDAIKIALTTPKYYPNRARTNSPSGEPQIVLTDNGTVFGSAEWEKRFNSYEDDIKHNRLAPITYMYPGCLYNEVFEPLERVLRSSKSISAPYYKDLENTISTFISKLK